MAAIQHKTPLSIIIISTITLVMIIAGVPNILHYSALLVASVLDPEVSIFRPFTEEGFRHDQLIASVFVGSFPLLALLLLLIQKKYSRIEKPFHFYYSRFLYLILSFSMGTLIYLCFFNMFGGYFFNYQLDTAILNEVYADHIDPFKYGYFFASITLCVLFALSIYKAMTSKKG